MAAYKDQIENMQKKGTKNLITAKTVFHVRGKAKGTSHFKYDMMHRLKTEYQRCSAKTRLRISSSKCKMLTSIKCYVKLQQHFSTKILYCYLNI